MQSIDNHNQEYVITPESTPLPSSRDEPSHAKKNWVHFDDKDKNETDDGSIGESRVRIKEDNVDGQDLGVATIEPSYSIQLANPSESSHIAIDVHPNIIPSSSSIKLPFPSSVIQKPVSSQSHPLSSQFNVSNNRDNNNQEYVSNESQSEYHIKTTSSTLQSVPLKDELNSNEMTSNQNDIALYNPNHVHDHHGSNTNRLFSNGDVIVTLLPLNSHCAWLSPAVFKPELVPEELMAQCLSLTVEDYVSAMQILVNDLRFNLYITLYKRILFVWIMLGFIVLLTLLFSGVTGIALFSGGVLWLIINALGIFLSMFIKIKLYHLLERCIAQVNAMLYKSNILVGIDDRGKISCHKINLVFIYFDVTSCIKFLKDMLEAEESSRNSGQSGQSSTPRVMTANAIFPSRIDIDTSDIVITSGNNTRTRSLSQKEKFAEKLFLRYSQRWVKDYVRRRIDFNLPVHVDASMTPTSVSPRHCTVSRCPCQFIEEHLRYKPLAQCSLRELFM